MVHTLWQRKKRVKERKFKTKNTASSSKHYLLVDLVFLLTESADQKRQKNRGENWRNYYDVLVPGMRITSRTLWTTTNIRKAGPAAKGRDNEGQMRRSHVCFFGLVATCDVPGTCPTQKLPLFLSLIQMRPRKNKSRMSEILRPGRYRTCLLYTSPSPRD